MIDTSASEIEIILWYGTELVIIKRFNYWISSIVSSTLPY